MNLIEPGRIEAIFEEMRGVRVAVVGDLMLDRYVLGKVERISPEAPVPIVSLEDETANLGGAANVAANAGALGAEVQLFGVVGDDAQGERLRELVIKRGYSDDGIVTDSHRLTSVKTRVISQNQHIIRIDRESVNDLDDTTAFKLLGRFGTDLNRFDAVILQDYNKGVLTSRVIKQVVEASRANNVLVGVDPKLKNFWEYTGVTLFKPNLRELESALGLPLCEEKELREKGLEVTERLNAKSLLITRGSKGMLLFSEGEVTSIPTQARRVHDVSGAGDTVIATIMIAQAAGATMLEAATLANHAASVVIAEVGAVPIDLDKLRRSCLGK